MRKRGLPTQPGTPTPEQRDLLPTPSASYRRRAWLQFQRALDPLAPVKPLPPGPRH